MIRGRTSNTTYRSRRPKITITLSPEVADRLNALAAVGGRRSRSRLVEEALRRWLDEKARQNLDRQTEEYYRSLSAAEQDEDKEWAALASDGARRLWED